MIKNIGMMALGMGMGAGVMYVANKNGSVTKAINKGKREINKATKKINNE